jgi:polyisoprenoid-binding protein YceI
MRATDQEERALSEDSTSEQTLARGTWKLDPNHTVVGAVARHLMVTKVRGHFKVFEGAIHVEDTVEDSWGELEIDAASIDTGVPDRDAHLRSADFLDVEKFPKITYRSTKVERTGDTKLRVTGDLTIRDVTRSIVMDVTSEGLTPDPWGGTRAAFSATGELEREDWGMTWNVALEKGGVLVSKSVQLDIEAQAVQPKDAIEEAESKPADEAAEEVESKPADEATAG